jgi:peptide chain release factor 1
VLRCASKPFVGEGPHPAGPEPAQLFRNESGGHRWQRVPPTEKRGRVHTSTVTVAVLREPEPTELVLDARDLVWSTCRASGSGGQHLQKTDSAVQVIHRPSGLVVRCESERSQHTNRDRALGVLRARLAARDADATHRERNAQRREQIGCGQRGDKRRTVRVRDGIVTDHVLGVRVSLRDYLRGELGPIVE